MYLPVTYINVQCGHAFAVPLSTQYRTSIHFYCSTMAKDILAIIRLTVLFIIWSALSLVATSNFAKMNRVRLFALLCSILHQFCITITAREIQHRVFMRDYY